MPIDPADIAICIEDPVGPDAGTGGAPMAAPIVQTSLFSYPDFDSLLAALEAEHEHHVYTRGSNPTVEVLECKLAALERGESCRCFASGMAAISAVLLGLLRAGDHILFVNDVYGPTLQLANELRRFGIEHDVQLDTDSAAVRDALRPNTRLIWTESPGTMRFRTVDLAALAQIARQRDITTCIDNSWATPLLQKPITLGIDVVVHSCTKYIGGHSDVVAGAVIADAARMHRIFYRAYMLNGGVLGPFDAWLLLRGMRTLPVRLRQHGADALRIAEFLRAHDRVARVFHPAYDAGARGFSGWAGLFAFELDGAGFTDVRRFIDALERFRIGVSWGGVESLVISPNRCTNEAQLDAQGIPRGLIRLSVGLEGADALIDDLRAGFAALA